MNNSTDDPAAWQRARLELLQREKAHSRAADELAAARRALPKLKLAKHYVFDSTQGDTNLGELFDGCSQMIVQHFMLAPGDSAGCPMCSFWADGYDPMIVHLKQRDIAFAAVSRASAEAIDSFRRRMGWRFRWVSSGRNSFNADFAVSPSDEALAAGHWLYNHHPVSAQIRDLPGVSVFERDANGTIYHTYSTYGRGLDVLNAAYAYMDLAPLGRNEAGLPRPMAWVRRHDEY